MSACAISTEAAAAIGWPSAEKIAYRMRTVGQVDRLDVGDLLRAQAQERIVRERA